MTKYPEVQTKLDQVSLLRHICVQRARVPQFARHVWLHLRTIYVVVLLIYWVSEREHQLSIATAVMLIYISCWGIRI